MKNRVGLLLAVISALIFTVPVRADGNDLGTLLTGGVKGGYLGQYADNNKTRSGMGILDLKKGAVYIGDFAKDKYNGRGMLIMEAGDEIENAPGASVYVGSFIKGKKNGRGSCYAPNGDLIYYGRFDDDKPVGKYPSPNPDMSRYFSMSENSDGLYVGEEGGEGRDRFGLQVLKNGALLIGTIRDGAYNGVAIFIYGPGAWNVVNFKDNTYTDITSSDVFNARRQAYKAAKDKINAELWSGLSEVMSGLVEVGAQYQTMHSGGASAGASGSSYSGSESSGMGAASSGGSSSRPGAHSSANNKKKDDCGTAWMSDSRVYSDYETQLIKGGQSISDRNSIRSKMKSIRKKWEGRGCPFTKSPHEDGN